VTGSYHIFFLFLKVILAGPFSDSLETFSFALFLLFCDAMGGGRFSSLSVDVVSFRFGRGGAATGGGPFF
jgi:hypothetical protein